MENMELAQETQMLVHQVQLAVFDMWNAKKYELSEEEALKMLDIRETLEELLIRIHDGAFEHR